jgi:putative PEP-CTERM system histidine kinase
MGEVAEGEESGTKVNVRSLYQANPLASSVLQMSSGSILAFSAAVLCVLLALAVLLKRRTVPAWFFAAGMLVFAVESGLRGLSFSAFHPDDLSGLYRGILIANSFSPFIWIAFSLTYLRGDYLAQLHRSRFTLAAAFVLPGVLAIQSWNSPVSTRLLEGGVWQIEYDPSALAINVVVLVATILTLANLEKTMRAAVGTARWKIKFALLGLGVIFGARVYTVSQSLLFSGIDPQLMMVEISALLVGCILMGVALFRQGFASIDLYPSSAVLQSSVTLILAGGYLVAVGVLAQLAAALGGAGSFQFQAMVVLAGVATLAVLLFSDRLRQRLRAFVSRHFRRPQHDARGLWSAFTHRLSSVTDPGVWCGEAVKQVAESFQALSVAVWLHDQRQDCLSPGASTVALTENDESSLVLTPATPVVEGLRKNGKPFDLDRNGEPWSGSLRAVCPPHFKTGGGRLCLPLIAADRVLGVMVLMDRVSGRTYTTEEYDLLRCIGDQLAAGLLQFQLVEELLQSREMQAFQTMSTFFVHDLKNAASSLGLMLQNLPVHFDNPGFREDAIRGIGATVARINQIVSRLGSLRQKLELKPVQTDLNALIAETLDEVNQPSGIEVIRDFLPVPPVMADREQLQSVITNLLINAREAMDKGGKITMRTARQNDRALISVEDTGCGMSSAFIRDSLFRPFCSTKKKGLGIGMFQCRMIVHAHHGSIQVTSEPGRGSTFLIFLPLKTEAA